MTRLKQPLKNTLLAIGLAGIIGCSGTKTEIRNESYPVTKLWLKNIAGKEQAIPIVEYIGKDGKKNFLYNWGYYNLKIDYENRKEGVLTFDSVVTGKSHYAEFYTLHLPEYGDWEWKKEQ